MTPISTDAAKAKNLARASEDLDVYMKNMSIQSKILNSLKAKAFGNTHPFASSFQALFPVQALVSGCSASGVADVFGIPSCLLLALPSTAAPITGEWVCQSRHPLPGLGSTLGLSLEFLHMVIEQEAAGLCRKDQPTLKRGRFSSIPLSESPSCSCHSVSL